MRGACGVSLCVRVPRRQGLMAPARPTPAPHRPVIDRADRWLNNNLPSGIDGLRGRRLCERGSSAGNGLSAPSAPAIGVRTGERDLWDPLFFGTKPPLT